MKNGGKRSVGYGQWTWEEARRAGRIHRSDAALDVELFIDVLEMCFYGFFNNKELSGYFLVAESFFQTTENFYFPAGENRRRSRLLLCYIQTTNLREEAEDET